MSRHTALHRKRRRTLTSFIPRTSDTREGVRVGSDGDEHHSHYALAALPLARRAARTLRVAPSTMRCNSRGSVSALRVLMSRTAVVKHPPADRIFVELRQVALLHALKLRWVRTARSVSFDTLMFQRTASPMGHLHPQVGKHVFPIAHRAAREASWAASRDLRVPLRMPQRPSLGY